MHIYIVGVSKLQERVAWGERARAKLNLPWRCAGILRRDGTCDRARTKLLKLFISSAILQVLRHVPAKNGGNKELKLKFRKEIVNWLTRPSLIFSQTKKRS